MHVCMYSVKKLIDWFDTLAVHERKCLYNHAHVLNIHVYALHEVVLGNPYILYVKHVIKASVKSRPIFIYMTSERKMHHNIVKIIKKNYEFQSLCSKSAIKNTYKTYDTNTEADKTHIINEKSIMNMKKPQQKHYNKK